MTKQYLGWEKLNELGQKYHELVQEGNGTTVENRTSEQVEIANTIVAGTKDYLFGIALRLIQSSVRVNSERKLSLASEKERIGTAKTVSIDDLVQEGAIAILRRMNNYDPDKGSIEEFIAVNAASVMHRRAAKLLYSVYVKLHTQTDVRKLSRATADDSLPTRGEIIMALSQKMIQGEEWTRIMAAQLSYDSLRGELVGVDTPLPSPDEDWRNSFFYRPSFEPREARIPSPLPSPEESAGLKEFQTHVYRVMREKLTHKERFIVEKYLGMDGKERSMDHVKNEYCTEFEVDVTRQSVYNIYRKALGKLRHPARRLFLVEHQPSTTKYLRRKEKRTKDQNDALKAFRELTTREMRILRLYGF